MKSFAVIQRVRAVGYARVLALCMSFFITLIFNFSSVWGQTPVAANGQLSVSGTQLVNENGDPVQLRGMSTHGLQWYGYCVNYEAISALVRDWGADVLRLAMYPDEDNSGWVYDKDYYNSFIDDLVNLTEQFGIYCIIDWHVHIPGDPMSLINEAKEFWGLMSSKYAGKKHIIYEICNEPNGVDWNRITEYADQIIPTIRANDTDQIILVGTPAYSQDVDIASQNPLTYDNLLYSLHFYAGTHNQTLRDKANAAISNGIGLFVTEWGTSNADGNGGPYMDQTNEWISWVNSNNLSWCNWSFSDKNEVSAALVNGSCLGNEWNNTSTSGSYVKDIMLNPADTWEGNQNIPPTASITTPVEQSKYEVGDTITIEASASDQDGSVSLVEFYAGPTKVKVGESPTSPYSVKFVANATGVVELSVTVTDNDGATNNSNTVSIEILEQIDQFAYPDGTPHAVPGAINASYFDIGGEGIAYHDVDATNKGGFNRIDEGVDTEGSEDGNVGYVVNGEWVEYTIDVASAGTYTFEIRVASEPGGGQFHLEFDGVDKTGIQNVGATGGWSSYTTLRVEGVGLDAGVQVMRMAVEVGDFNFATMTFTFAGTSVPPTGVTVSSTVLTLQIGESSDLIETVLPTNATNKSVTWTTSNSAVATVNSDGLVTAVGEGTATITVATVSGGYTDQCAVTVAAVEATGVSLNANSIELDINETFALDATVTPGNASDPSIAWSSSNEGVATVSSSGVVTGVAEGQATITAQSSNPAVAATCAVDVTKIVALPEYTLTVSSSTGGSVGIVPVAGTYLQGTVVELVANADAGYRFAGWSGDLSGTDSIVNVTMDSDKQITATFVRISGCVQYAPAEFPITIDGEGEYCYVVSGTIEYVNSWNLDQLMINGVGYANSWAGNIPADENGNYYIHYESSVDWGHMEIVGSSEPVENFTLSVSAQSGGSVSDVSGQYPSGASVTITATADPGYVFTGWTGDATGTDPTTAVTMDADKNIVAAFSEEPSPTQYTLTMVVVGAGSVAPAEGEHIYSAGTEVNLSAAPATGYIFDGWSGDLISGNATASVVMDQNKTITATFVEDAPQYYTVTVGVVGNGSVTVSPDQAEYLDGSTVTLTATAVVGNHFVSWGGDASGTTDVVEVVVDANKSITATFAPDGNAPCETPTTISVPFSQDGAGEFCWFTTDEIAYINSWNIDEVKVNGTDMTNNYYSIMPAKIDGGYFISCTGSFGWSHFEAASTKFAGMDSFVDVQVYPNPFDVSTKLIIANSKNIQQILVYDQVARVVTNYETNEIQPIMNFGENLEKGVYFLKVISESNNQTIILNKK